MSASGTGQTRVTNNAANDSLPTWSPDGSQIAFVSDRQDHTDNIYVMTLASDENASLVRLTTDGPSNTFPAWSPDGSKILFQSNRDGHAEICVMNADGTDQTRLTSTLTGGSYQPVWLDNGTKIGFTSDRDLLPEIYIMNADGTSQTRLTSVFGGSWTRGKMDPLLSKAALAAASGAVNPNEGVITTFQSGHGFTYTSGGGSSVDDPTFFSMGNQSLKVTTNGLGTQSVVTKTGISPTINISGEIIKLVVAVDNTERLTSNGQFLVAFSSDGFASNYAAYSATAAAWMAKPGGAWVTSAWSFADAYVSGTPNLAAINAIRIYVRDIGTGALNAWIQSISYYPPKLDHGIATFTFDDSYASQYTYGLAKLKTYGYPATAYIIPDSIGTSGSLSLAQLHDMQDNNGWDISAHDYEVLAGMTPAQTEAELLRIKNYLATNNLNGGQHFSYPGGYYDTSILLPLVKQYFTTAREATMGEHEVFPSSNYYGLKTISLTDPSNTPATIATQVTEAINNKDWLILVFHNLVTTTPQYSTEYSVSDFNAIVDNMQAQGIEVKTVSQVLAELNSVPSVTTNGASAIGPTAATLNGNLNSTGSATSVNLSFEYGLTVSYSSTIVGTPASLTAPGAFTANLTGLTPGILYHYRAKADGGSGGISYGNDQTFTAGGGVSLTLYENYHAIQNSTGIGLHAAQTFTPQVTHTITSAKLSLMNTGATGNITASIRAVNASGIPTGANLITSAPVPNSAIPAAFTTVTFNLGTSYMLQAGTTYALQVNSDTNGIFAQVDTTGTYPRGMYLSANDAQTWWNTHGGTWDIWFEDWGSTSSTTSPSVTTYGASAIGTTAATLSGNLNSTGSATSVSLSFEYGLTVSYGSTIAGTPASLTAPGTFTANLAGLTGGTVYHYRAKADGGTAGVVYGSDQTFTTAGVQTRLVIAAPNVVAPGGNITMTATVYQLPGLTPVATAGMPVQFNYVIYNLEAGTSQTGTATATTNASGTATLSLAAPMARSVVLIDAVFFSSGSFVASSNMKIISVLPVVEAKITATSTTAGVVTFHLADQYSNALAGKTLTFLTTVGSLSATSGVTSTTGNVTVTLTGTTSAVVSASFGGFTSSAGWAYQPTMARITVYTTTTTSVQTRLVTTAPNMVSPGDSITMTATVYQLPGLTPVTTAGMPVQFNYVIYNLEAGTTQTGSTAATTNASGTAALSLSAPMARSVVLVDAVFTGSGNFLASSNMKIMSVLPIVEAKITATSTSGSVTFHLADQYGNAMAGRPLSYLTTGGTLSSASGVTNSAGDVMIILSGTTSAVVSASFGGFTSVQGWAYQPTMARITVMP
ncbi:MAG: PD40 domain-containing protein [Chloroflexi bacterium]|nr:PD40 domain-containing protein [Chloroflexota bacterium]